MSGFLSGIRVVILLVRLILVLGRLLGRCRLIGGLMIGSGLLRFLLFFGWDVVMLVCRIGLLRGWVRFGSRRCGRVVRFVIRSRWVLCIVRRMRWMCRMLIWILLV